MNRTEHAAGSFAGSFDALRRFVRRPPPPVEHCELCNQAVSAAHQHLLETASRRLICACDACALLFDNRGQTKYKRVPRRIRFLPEFRMTDSQWDGLMMPINMAFFFHSTPRGRVIALYPSPAGATESLLSFDTWDEIVAENPTLLEMEADVEALLVNRIDHARALSSCPGQGSEYFIVPIDECFRLTGLIRSRWRGLSGGNDVWREIGRFFQEMRGHA